MWKKEYTLLVVAALCIVVYYYRESLNKRENKPWLDALPIFGGIAFGFNTLINLTK